MPVQTRSVETRETMLLAAAQEFDEHGYTGSSVQDIADRLGKTKGALGYHFPSKSSMALAIVERFYGQLPGMVELYRAGGSMDVSSVVALSLDVARQFRDDVMVRAAVRLQRDAETIEVPLPTPYVNWIALIESGLRDAELKGQLMPDVDVAATARVAVAGFFGVQQVAATLGHRAELVNWVLDLWRVILPAIVGDAAKDTLSDAEARVLAPH
nr:ScbR family autoregulator-binding transcription factor [Planctomonas sp. JC2975]